MTDTADSLARQTRQDQLLIETRLATEQVYDGCLLKVLSDVVRLPDGREVVVTPGSMVPEVGLVVLAIGPQAVQLARVQPVGDHATVDAMTLTPQY